MGEQPRLTHVDDSGAARMVDVTGKDVTARTAVATGRVLVSGQVIALLRGDGVPKGDALGVARVAGIMAAKRTPDLIPLCHPLAISGVEVDLVVENDAVAITATVRTTDRTGVEMEALTAVSVAALTVCGFMGAESLILLGFDRHQAPIRAALRRVGVLIRQYEEAGKTTAKGRARARS